MSMRERVDKSSVGLSEKLSYMNRWLPGYLWRRLTRLTLSVAGLALIAIAVGRIVLHHGGNH